jgi:peptidoglycan/xylan/chitin deacetylase (PgdA/CDA1 family)
MPFLSIRYAAMAAIFFCAVISPLRAGWAGSSTDIDDKSAVIFAYFSVGDDANPNASVRTEQFMDQVQELSTDLYNVQPLPKIIEDFSEGRVLPARTIAITFDGADQSILDKAVPALLEKKLPFTIFIPAGRIGKAPYMDWDDLRSLKRSGLATFGVHTSDYSRMGSASEEDIRRQINSSLATIRKQLDIQPSFLAYPFGEYNAVFERVAKSMGFKAAFGQNSGVAYAGAGLYSLPRFTQTERYGDLERFRMTANALPLPAMDIAPIDPYLDTLAPTIGFTVPEALASDLKNISCFSSTNEKPVLEIIGKRRVEIRMDKDFSEDRPRINCTLPGPTQNVEEEPRWRWFGTLYTIAPNLLEDAEKINAAKTTKTSQFIDSVDDIRIE